MAGIANLFIFTYYGLETWYKHKKRKISSLCCSLSLWRTQPRECIFVPASPLFSPHSGITPPISISSPAIYDVQSWTISWLDAFLDRTIKEPILVSHSPAGPQLFFLKNLHGSISSWAARVLLIEWGAYKNVYNGRPLYSVTGAPVFWIDKDLFICYKMPSIINYKGKIKYFLIKVWYGGD